MSEPTITVLLPCYNSEATLRESIDSVLAQTFADFELLILDDGSTGMPEIPTGDPRIIYLRSDENLGLSRQLNLGLDRARGEFIARLDADDIAVPERFEKQLHLLRSSPDIGICGSHARLFDADGDREIWHYPTDPDVCHASIFLRSSFLHPGVMMRRRVLESNNLRYDGSLRVAQDYELWLRLLKVTSGTNLDECLTRYRISDSQLTRAQNALKEHETDLVRTTILDELGIGDLGIYNRVVATVWEESPEFFSRGRRLAEPRPSARTSSAPCFPPPRLPKCSRNSFSTAANARRAAGSMVSPPTGNSISRTATVHPPLQECAYA